VTVAVEPSGNRFHFEIFCVGGAKIRVRHRDGACHPGCDGQSRDRSPLIAINEFFRQQSHKGQSKKRCPVGEAFHG
jgi:hypothetical protein